MGTPMARRLVDSGFDVTVWNRTPARARSLVERGARLADSPAGAVSGAEAVVSMVAEDEASRRVWLGDRGALAAMDPGAIAIESSTLTVEWMRELAAAAGARGIDFLDAPVTGSKRQAEEGVLNFLVGGGVAGVERARPLFAAMGRGHVHVGPAGSGALLKLINNFLCGVQVASLAEAIAMAERSGLDAQVAGEVLASGSPGSPLVKMVVPRMLARDYTPNFLAPLMVKDLTYALGTFAAAGIDLPAARAARDRFGAAVAAGLEDQDIAAVIEPLRQARDL